MSPRRKSGGQSSSRGAVSSGERAPRLVAGRPPRVSRIARQRLATLIGAAIDAELPATPERRRRRLIRLISDALIEATLAAAAAELDAFEAGQ